MYRSVFCGVIAGLFAVGCHKATEPQAAVTPNTKLSVGQTSEHKPAEPPAVEPTPEQLKECQIAFVRLRATYRAETDPQTKKTIHYFRMPLMTTDAELKNLPHVPFPFGLVLISPQVTDAGLKELKDLKQLTSLDLRSTQVTDAGLKELKDLQQLNSLNIGFTKVTDAGLKELKDLKQLTTLYLMQTQVTGAGLRELKDLKHLTSLDLTACFT